MSFEIRKIVTYLEETHIEGGKATDKPVTSVSRPTARRRWSAPTARSNTPRR